MTPAVPDVSILVVSKDDAADLPVSLAGALAQTGVLCETLLVDNASTDASREVAARVGVRLLALPENVGFAAAMNAGIEATSGRYVLALNPDCRLAPDFASTLVRRLDSGDAADVGSASGRLLRAQGVRLDASDRLDSTGIFFTAAGRHFDRGAGEPEKGRYLREEEIFGPSGAAGFYRRAALETARISTGWFDADFFLYREDADLAWRLRRLGWRSLYVPGALGWHRRRNLPERRRSMTQLANLHSVKNRFLLRLNNQSAAEALRTAIPTFARDLLVLGACLTVERSSLPAFGWLWKNRRRLWAKRREIREKVTAAARNAPRPSSRAQRGIPNSTSPHRSRDSSSRRSSE